MNRDLNQSANRPVLSYIEEVSCKFFATPFVEIKTNVAKKPKITKFMLKTFFSFQIKL
jgi:hypothetical protein